MAELEIRELREDEIPPFVQLCAALDYETTFMMLEPGERDEHAEQQRAELESVIRAENSTILVAFDGGRLVGYVAAYGGEYRRNRHSATVVAGVLRSHAGRGIGRRLFESLLAWAGRSGVHRLELTVMAHNEPAIRLYRSLGFGVEGLRLRSLVVDGQPVDELAMALLLDMPG